MIEFFVSGGMVMWFVLVFGLAALVGAVMFARRPHELRLGALRALSWATAFASLSGFVAGLALTAKYCAQLPPADASSWHVMLLLGVSEASSNLILGSSLLALTWLVIAIGLRRLAAREATG